MQHSGCPINATRDRCVAPTLQSALAGSGERLKFELLHDEAAQVGPGAPCDGATTRRTDLRC